MKSNMVFEVDRKDYSKTRVVEQTLPELQAGQIRVCVERFAVTANTVTYAVAGDLLGYWDFFPAEDGWGRVPAMGWARIVESNHSDLAVGARYYGWFPMAQYVDFTATASRDGFRDDGVHRKNHAPVYRSYTQTTLDPLYQAGTDAEDRHALLRGLMQTAFLADDFLQEQHYFGASRCLILSASSKTAIALAELCATHDGLDLVGLTSTRNIDFVRGLGLYDQVLAYDEISTLPARQASVIVDMSGNTSVLDTLHRHLGESLKHSMAIGRSHHDAPRQPIGGVLQPSFFFAPLQGKKRVEQWGSETYGARVHAALSACIQRSQSWLDVQRHEGSEALQRLWQSTLAGQSDPASGSVASLHIPD